MTKTFKASLYHMFPSLIHLDFPTFDRESHQNPRDALLPTEIENHPTAVHFRLFSVDNPNELD